MTKKQQHLGKKTMARHEKRTGFIVQMYDCNGNPLSEVKIGRPVIFALQKTLVEKPWARIVLTKEVHVYDPRARRVVNSSLSRLLVDHRGKILYSFNFQLSGFGVRVGSDLTNENGVVPGNIIRFLGLDDKTKGS